MRAIGVGVGCVVLGMAGDARAQSWNDARYDFSFDARGDGTYLAKSYDLPGRFNGGGTSDVGERGGGGGVAVDFAFVYRSALGERDPRFYGFTAGLGFTVDVVGYSFDAVSQANIDGRSGKGLPADAGTFVLLRPSLPIGGLLGVGSSSGDRFAGAVIGVYGVPEIYCVAPGAMSSGQCAPTFGGRVTLDFGVLDKSKPGRDPMFRLSFQASPDVGDAPTTINAGLGVVLY